MTEGRFTAPAAGTYEVTWEPVFERGQKFLVEWIPGPHVPSAHTANPDRLLTTVVEVVMFETAACL